jgi:hypothetical protein
LLVAEQVGLVMVVVVEALVGCYKDHYQYQQEHP